MEQTCRTCKSKVKPVKENKIDKKAREKREEEEGWDARSSWVERYNNSLPQRTWYDEEFECDMSMGIGGIYDSEYDNFVFNNFQSKRIKQLLEQEG
jgi:hypothetical protein